MVATELLILGLLDVLCLLSIVLFALWMRRELEESVAELDSTLAQAIQSTLDKLTGEGVVPYDPPNPLQAALAQFVLQKMSAIDTVVQPQGPDGKFQKTIDEFQ